ncbi:AMP-binding protein [Variovorax sp. J22P240]|uniref:class I adenylate-forming enzyme family protein n=1 Tax=Variovorax sp. J22P240 TaxID=3053514 RepID=UPI00257491F1|nr:AMP-binding protein [Variovorax sp. J22P240]MDM0002394.1 AMP-binding protein [Variovorax sp. J22P240]
MNHWRDFPVPAMRHEALYGDRIVRCFAERPARLHAMFERARAMRPQHDAMVFEGRRWSYAETGDAADRLAAAFAAQGIEAGERVLMLMGNRPEFLLVLLALQRLGAITVPVGIREQRPGLAYIAVQCGAKAIAFDDELGERLPDAVEAPALTLRLAASGLAALAASAPTPPPAAATRETDVAVILYTSGTTGHPKGALLTHLSIAHSALHFQSCMDLRPDDRSALAVPASHVTGLIAIIASMWQVGGAVIVVPEFKANAFVQLVARERVSHTLMVPAMYKLCLLSEGFDREDLSSWRIGGFGGAPMPVATIDALAARLPGLTLLNAYGATETTSPVTMMPAGLTRAHIDSVGVALPAAEIRVMDEEGREVAPGETGELWIGGPMVVPGYWANPQATADSFTAGFWHSGDLGSVDAEGFVRIFDRKKDMLNRGGYKVYSVEVENVLMAWPGVVEAAVIGKPCPVLGERVHAFVHAPGITIDEAALRQHCAQRLADYKVPESFTWSPEPLPRNPNGKLLKRLLRARI